MGLYTKMIAAKFDTGNLGIIAARMCEQDYEFSKLLAPVLLKGLNNIVHSESAIVILTVTLLLFSISGTT